MSDVPTLTEKERNTVRVLRHQVECERKTGGVGYPPPGLLAGALALLDRMMERVRDQTGEVVELRRALADAETRHAGGAK